MKLKEGFLLHDIDGNHMAVATGEAAKTFNGLVRNNSTADFIYKQLLKETTEEKIVSAMCQEYDAPIERITADVKDIISQLRKAGFLDE